MVGTTQRTAAGLRGRGISAVSLRPIGRFAKTQPMGFACVVVLILVVLVAVFADVIVPYDPLIPAPLERLQGPSLAHPFGTDEIGRDVMSRVIHGSRVSLLVGFTTVGVAVGLGGLIGLISGFVGNWTDMIIQRVMDSLIAIPALILAIAVASILGAGTLKSIVPIAIAIIPINARVVRSIVLSIREQQYVEAARATGCTTLRIMARHVLPNTLAPVFVLASIWLGNAIIIEASLSFLGLGTPPPDPSWGNMLSRAGRAYLEQAPWIAIFPGLAITITVLAVNLFGDAMRDTLDPRMRGGV
ncbi:MAG: ABC transporter permease subunit [Dehalococcoidia bacterium]|nr:ABC transporter permease subunit [Dehalococcoidia bacterium]